jgi:hypothetical protein
LLDKSPFKDINLYKDYTKVKPLNSTSEEEVSKSSKSEAPLVDNNDNDEVFQNNVQVTTLLPCNYTPPQTCQYDTNPPLLIIGSPTTIQIYTRNNKPSQIHFHSI